MLFSVIVPLYNRPIEIKELLESLSTQIYTQFEVIVVEDGSVRKAEDIVASFQDRLTIRYYYKENEGQGLARNFGFSKAKGDYFIVFDSDVIVPDDYFENVMKSLNEHHWDAFGGPDAAHPSFTLVQKAISYAMTSPFTTGGIRGNKKHIGAFHPRSFNMGISRKVYQDTGGFQFARRSEDIEFSIRMIQAGYKVGLIPEAFVYHKRRTNFSQFYRQTRSFGKGRIDIYKRYPNELKPVHVLPPIFVVAISVLIMINVLNLLTLDAMYVLHLLGLFGNLVVLLYVFALFAHAVVKTKDPRVAVLAVIAAFTQLWAYGSGFIAEWSNRFLLDKNESRID